MDLGAPLVADRQSTKLIQPGQCALDDPAMTSQPVTRFLALSGDPDADAAPTQKLTTARDIIRLVTIQFGGPLPSLTARSLDRWDRVDQFLEDDAVMPVGTRDPVDERDAVSIRNNVALRPRFAAVRRVRTGRGAPFFAGTLALSRQARSQSMASARPSSSNNSRWSRSQTPAACQSRRRRQHVIPLPQPSSWGSISQGIPLLRTKMIPARHARSGTRGRPPFGLGGSGGNSGSIRSQSASDTSGVAIFPPFTAHAASGIPWFC